MLFKYTANTDNHKLEQSINLMKNQSEDLVAEYKTEIVSMKFQMREHLIFIWIYAKAKSSFKSLTREIHRNY